MPETIWWETAIPPTLEEAQALVGGLVQVLYFNYGDEPAQMLIWEEAKLFPGWALNTNHEATALMQGVLFDGDVIVGTALILRGDAMWS